jgi:hypothetical protein
LMACLDEVGEVPVCGRPTVAVGLTKLGVRRQIMCRIVPPLSLEEAVGGRKEFKRANAQVREIGVTGRSDGEVAEVLLPVASASMSARTS